MPAPDTSLALADTVVTADGAGNFALTLTTRPFNTTDIIVIAGYCESSAVSTISDSTALPWSNPVAINDAGNGQMFVVFYRNASATDINNAVTYFVNSAALANHDGIFGAIVVQAGQFDAAGSTQANPASGSPYALCSGALTPATATDLALAFFNIQQTLTSPTVTDPTGFALASSNTGSFGGVGSAWNWHDQLASGAAIQPSTTPTFTGASAGCGAVLLFKPLGTTQNISATDTAATTSDAVSMATTPASGQQINPDTALQMSDTAAITVTTHTGANPFFRGFRFGNWM